MTDYKIESLLLDKRACIAAMEHDTAKYGEWRSDHASHLYSINAELDALLSPTVPSQPKANPKPSIRALREGYLDWDQVYDPTDSDY
jgi:hypothetical protein